MSNPTKIYNDYVRANLPSTMTFDSTTGRYDINNHSFLSFKEANWYFKYVTKYGYTSLSVYAVNNFDPDLVFDFKQNYYRTGGTATTLSSAVTHTRASSATMTNSSGTLVTVGNNVARTGHHVYNGSAWVNEGILHESEARTNAISTSEVAPTAYSNGITKAVDSSVVSPAGGNNVEKFTLSSANEQHYFGNHNAISASSGYSTYSIFAKGSGHNLIRLRMKNTVGLFYCDYNLATGQKQVNSSAHSSVTGAIESMGNGWWRCSMTYASEKTNPYATVRLINAMDAPLLNSFLGDGTSGVYVWGSQYEVGSTPSSYIPTSGSTVTRAADTLTVPAANLPYSSTNMSIQIDGRMTYADQDEFSAHQFMRWRASGSDNIASAGGTNTGDGLRVLFQQVAGGVNDTIPTGVVYNEGILVPFNLSSRHGSTFINGATDGTALTADTTPVALPDLSTTNLELGYDFMGTIAQFRMWDEDLGDTGIAEAST